MTQGRRSGNFLEGSGINSIPAWENDSTFFLLGAKARKNGARVVSGRMGELSFRRSVSFLDTNVKRGDIYYADLSPVVGSEQGGVRPVLIVQNDTGNRYSPTVIAAAITSQVNKARLPTHVPVPAGNTGLQKDSVILAEQIRTLDKRRLRERIGSLPPEIMEKVSEALRISLAVDRNEGAQRGAAPI